MEAQQTHLKQHNQHIEQCHEHHLQLNIRMYWYTSSKDVFLMDEDTELGERTSCQENVEVALENDKDKDKVDSNSD